MSVMLNTRLSVHFVFTLGPAIVMLVDHSGLSMLVLVLSSFDRSFKEKKFSD